MVEPQGEDYGQLRRPIDFTSSLYLGIRHASRSLRPWPQLTAGRPAALGALPGATAIAEALAELVGCERATLLPSTMHLFFDLFEVLREEGVRIYIDAGAYPIACWGAERAAARGAALREIPHYDPAAARRIIDADRELGLRPVILADGFCPECGRPVPLRQYLQCVARDDGYVVLDDTQAVGIWGSEPGARAPYGKGGGGSLRLHAIQSAQVVTGSSLAKGFGVPLAVLGGSREIVARFQRRSETRVHASPPSIAVLHAAEHALTVNARDGDGIRRQLARTVGYFRRSIRPAGLRGSASRFPVQMLSGGRGGDLVALERKLGEAGVHTALVQPRSGSAAKLVFVLNALHTKVDIDRAATILVDLSQ